MKKKDRKKENIIFEIFIKKRNFKEFQNNYLKESPLNIISVWRPRKNFHFGQYACLKTLDWLKKINNNINITIIIGQDEDKYELDKEQFKIETETTDIFINEFSDLKNSITIIETSKYTVDTINNNIDIVYGEYLEFRNHNKDEKYVKNYEKNKREWDEHKLFIFKLIQNLKNTISNLSPPIYILSSNKHSYIWDFFSKFLSEKIGKDIKAIYIKDILDLENGEPMRTSNKKGNLILIDDSYDKIEKKINNFFKKLNDDKSKNILEAFYRIIIIDKLFKKEILFNDFKSISQLIKERINNINKIDNIEEEIIEYIFDLSKKWTNTIYNILRLRKIKIFNVINNEKLVNYIKQEKKLITNSDLFNVDEKEFNKINETPELLRADYVESIKEILGNLNNTLQNQEIKDIYDKIIKTEIISNLYKIDLLLYFTEKWHRDHYLHQFNVGALGIYFLDIYVNDNLKLINELVLGKNINEDDFTALWWLTALLHDHALPFEEFIKLIPLIYKLEKLYHIKNLRKTILYSFFEIIKPLLHEKLNSYFENLLNSENPVNIIIEIKNEGGKELYKLFGNELDIKFNIWDHGHLGTLNLAYLFNNEKISNNYINLILKAIALHNNNNQKITLYQDPLTFLLILCDELQEWTRRQFPKASKLSAGDINSYSTNPEKFMTHSINDIEIELLNDKLKLKYLDDLTIKFNCKEWNELKKIGWLIETFLLDKHEKLKYLDFSSNRENYKPKKIIFTTNIPTSLHFE